MIQRFAFLFFVVLVSSGLSCHAQSQGDDGDESEMMVNKCSVQAFNDVICTDSALAGCKDFYFYPCKDVQKCDIKNYTTDKAPNAAKYCTLSKLADCKKYFCKK